MLVIYEAGLSFPAIAIVDQEIRKALDQSPYQIELYTENMDEILFPDESSQREFREWYVHKYRDHKPDLIIAEGPPPINFMVEAHERSFPGTPIVFCCSPQGEADALHLDSSFTGVWMEKAPAETLEAALRLRPNTRHVVVVGGVSSYDRNVERITRDALRKYEGSLEFTYFTDLELPALLERLRHLSENTIVLYTSFSQDAAGTSFIDAKESFPMVVSVANAPVFVMSETFLGRGEVGGSVTSYTAQGRVVGEIALQILRGEKPQNIPIVKIPNIYEFDWTALQRWGLNASKLPPGSIVLHRPPTPWERIWKYVLAAIVVIVVQSLLIIGLLMQRARKEKAEAVLRESEERFRLVANTAPVLIWMSGGDKHCTYFNKPWLDFTGRSFEAELGNGWTEGVHPEDLKGCVETYAQSFDRKKIFRIEYRLRRYDGEYRWISDIGVPRFNPDGSFAGYIGSAIDVTERKQAEEALAGMSRRLIEAHEEERTWIARELHDDINQRLALLSISLMTLKQHFPNLGVQASNGLDDAAARVSELGKDVQALSHRLHSSKLEYLGLVSASRSFCREFSEQQHVKVAFNSEHIPDDLPKEIALCLFRVLQEALQNANKYSGSDHFQVVLQGDSNQIELTVSDSGRGFDPQATTSGHGLGLTSMKERVKLVDGHLSIESKPLRGTTIRAGVPVRSGVKSTKAIA